MKKIFLLAVIGFSNILTAQSYITGGYPINISEAPHQVSLQNGGRHFCGGSIINKQWIVTAAHCIESSDFSVNVGLTRLDSPSSNTKSYDVERYIIHPQYGNGHIYNNDIALVKIKGNFSFNQDVKLINIELPTENLHSVGQQTKVSGWGRPSSHSNSVSNELLMVNVPIISNIEAQNQLRRYVTDNMIATSSVDITRRGACQGDSGGPLTTKNEQGETKLIGIVSWGDPYCSGGSTSPSIYTKVANYIDWIKQYVPLSINIQGSSIICDNTTQTYTIDNNDNNSIQWQLSSDIEEVSRTNNSITIKPKSGFNGLATLTAYNGIDYIIQKIWIGKPRVNIYQDLNHYRELSVLEVKSFNKYISLKEQDIISENILWHNLTTGRKQKGDIWRSYIHSSHDSEDIKTLVSNKCGKEEFITNIKRICQPSYGIYEKNSSTYLLNIHPCDEPIYFYKKSYSMHSKNNFTIQISNAMGQIVLTTKNKEFSLAHLLSGTYYARVIKNGQVVHTQTLLKQ